MNRATHTPGPWKYDGSSDPLPHDKCCSAERIAAGGVTIAEVATCEDDTCPGVSEGWANARLIAAAPELLAACRELLEWTRDEYQSEVNEDALGPVWRAARAAIAKATPSAAT